MRRGPSWSSTRATCGLVAVVGVGDVAANLTFGLASTRGLVSVVAVLGSLYPVVTVLLARVVHHERLGRPQTLGVVLALAGVGADRRRLTPCGRP